MSEVDDLREQLAAALEANRRLHRRVQAEEGPAFAAAAKARAERKFAETTRDLHYRSLQIMQAGLNAIVAECADAISGPNRFPRERVVAGIALQALGRAWQVHVSDLGKPLPSATEPGK
jgi:hypothetical protein